jgi:hypothetical protein
MGFFSTPKTDAELKSKALAAYSKLDRLEDRQKVGELFINNPTINRHIFNPSPIMQAKRLKQQYNKKGENTIEPKNFGKYYFGIGTTNNDPGAGAALNDIMAQFGTPALGMRIGELIEKKMMLEGKDQDAAYQILLDSVNTIPKRNNSVNAELDDLFNKMGKMGKNAGSFFGGNVKKNHKRHRKTKKTRNTRRTRRNKRRRSA